VWTTKTTDNKSKSKKGTHSGDIVFQDTILEEQEQEPHIQGLEQRPTTPTDLERQTMSNPGLQMEQQPKSPMMWQRPITGGRTSTFQIGDPSQTQIDLLGSRAGESSRTKGKRNGKEKKRSPVRPKEREGLPLGIYSISET
jgi:hypothetical protein